MEAVLLSHPQGWLTTPTPPVPTLLGCPGEVQSLLSLALQLVRSLTRSPILMTPGPALPHATGGKGWGKRTSLPLPYHHIADEGWGQNSQGHGLMTGSMHSC